MGENISVSINLDALRSNFLISLQSIIGFVTYGMNSAKNVKVDDLHLPGTSVSMLLDLSSHMSTEEFEKKYTNWLVVNGFQDLLESLNSFIEESHKVLSFWELAEKQAIQKTLTMLDWQEIIEGGEKKYEGYGFPEKVDHLKSNHGLHVDEKIIQQVLSINKARNCLVHRQGIVSEKDVNIQNYLSIRWNKLAIVIHSKDSEKPFCAGKPQKVAAGDVVVIKHTESTKEFSIGQQVVFSSGEFADIAYGIFLIGDGILAKINEYGLINGYIHDTQP